MRIIKLISEKAQDNMNKKAPTIAFFGDSVTQGCFEVYRKNEKDIETVFEKEYAYHSYVVKILSVLYPSVPINVINAGISGDYASHALKRIDEDVICHNPDLAVVCFGLNDVNGGLQNIDQYAESLDKIFKRLIQSDIEVIFMTPNMMNTYTDYSISDSIIKGFADKTANLQNDGIMDKYMDKAREVCRINGVAVCDCYQKWKTLYKNSADITALLSNKINHPTRDMNYLFAFSLVEKFFE